MMIFGNGSSVNILVMVDNDRSIIKLIIII